ncbi:MAG: hypothetical protein ACK5AZ_04180 [Bryobacteraceae bacterium]
MLASLVIIVFSLVLFVYWFRYTCLLILRAMPTQEYASQVAEANHLNFLAVQDRLRAGAGADLDELHTMLERDYNVLTYLLRHAAEFQVGGDAIEHRMLMIDYGIMKAWYSVSRRFASSHSWKALEEMSQVVGYFAHAMGEGAQAESRG